MEVPRSGCGRCARPWGLQGVLGGLLPSDFPEWIEARVLTPGREGDFQAKPKPSVPLQQNDLEGPIINFTGDQSGWIGAAGCLWSPELPPESATTNLPSHTHIPQSPGSELSLDLSKPWQDVLWLKAWDPGLEKALTWPGPKGTRAMMD